MTRATLRDVHVWLEARDIVASRTNVHASPAATVPLNRRSKAHALNCSTAAIEWDAARAAFLWHLCHREPLQARSRANRFPAKSSMGRRRSDRGQRVRRRRACLTDNPNKPGRTSLNRRRPTQTRYSKVQPPPFRNPTSSQSALLVTRRL
jgi:hypothetical protein